MNGAKQEIVTRANPGTAEHLAARWDVFEEAGPLAVLPIRRTYQAGAWGPDRLSLFAGLYPREPFESLEDFEVFARYTSSIQQWLIRDGEVDLEWFIPETKEEGVAELLAYLESRPKISGPAARAAMLELELPGEFRWILELELHDVVIDAGDDGLEVSAKTDEGYLSVFALLD